MWAAIGTSGPEVVIGDVPDLATVIGAAPTAWLACGGYGDYYICRSCGKSFS